MNTSRRLNPPRLLMVVLYLARLIITVSIILPAVPCEAAQARIALVIGNGTYRYDESLPRLSSPGNDAAAVREILAGFQFDVTSVQDADHGRMVTVIDTFIQQIQRDKDALALFYYSGHGEVIDGHQFLAPTDAHSGEVREMISFDEVVRRMQNRLGDIPHGANILILDACRSPPKGPPVQITYPAERNTLIAYATLPGGVARSGLDQSPFTACLVESMCAHAAESIGDILTYTRGCLSERVGEGQIGQNVDSTPTVLSLYSGRGPLPPVCNTLRRFTPQTIVVGCDTDGVGPSIVGWCSRSQFYGLVYFGSFFFSQDEALDLISIGQVGLVNMTHGEWSGIARVGLVNASGQFAGFLDLAAVSYTRRMFKGMQSGIMTSVAGGDFAGLQLGTVSYVGGNLDGLQVGVVNYAGIRARVGQLGVINHAGEGVIGFQAGGVNYAGHGPTHVQGLQLGLVNYADRLDGAQVGVINVSRRGGLPIMPVVNLGVHDPGSRRTFGVSLLAAALGSVVGGIVLDRSLINDGQDTATEYLPGVLYGVGGAFLLGGAVLALGG